MKTILLKEIRLNLKALLIWAFSVGGMGLVCIILYKSMQGDMKQMADAFSNMGAFSDAFGMSTLSIATLKGYFATEVGAVHGLGGGMFAAIISVGILSKEEEGHTGEFLFSLPIARKKVVLAKGICVLCMLAVFTLICGAMYCCGIAALGEEIPAEEFCRFMGMQFLMNLEIAAVCFAISAASGKSKMGLGIGLAMGCYFYDVIGRVVPDAKDYLFAGPYSYANASEIFTGAEADAKAIILAAAVIIAGVLFAHQRYDSRDLAS
ncbi:MAG: ABC transporter permease [Lachnospiraceae bacterium]|nr:ABC transporter permease [Lachnospiraceae bacterium]